MKKALLMALSLASSAMADGLEVGTYDPAAAGDYVFSFAWWGNQVRDEVTKNAADYFTQNYPNITFNLNAQSWNNYWALMSTNAANNDLPDVMQQDYAYIEQWVEAGDLLDLTPYVESGALDLSSMPQNIIDTGKVGDGLYAICCAVNAPAMLYNKTLTDSLGIEVPMNITWDEFAEISRTIYAETGVGAIYGDGNSENPLTYYVRSLGYTPLWDENGLVATAEEMAGYYARLMSRIAGRNGHVYAVEPVAPIRRVLERNLSGCGNVDILPYALGAAEGEIRMGNATVRTGGYFGTGQNFVMEEGAEADVEFTAEMRRGSELFGHLTRIDFIKCDVEGYEVVIMEEMRPLLERFRPTVLIETGGENRDRIVALFTDLGYDAYTLHRGQEIPLRAGSKKDIIFRPKKKR